MSTPPRTADPFAALAEELGRIGHRLDDMGAELVALRWSGGPVGAGPEPKSAPWSRKGDARVGDGVASDLETVSEGAAHGGPIGGPAGWA
jgi:hypothetical protein